MTGGIKIRRLRLHGSGRSYDVSFVTDGGSVRPLSIIGGEISTGKSSVLQFIDYCLGASSHPKHPEIERRVSAASIEVEIGDAIVVIRRTLFDYARASVHHCSLEDLANGFHEVTQLVIKPAGAENSLSQYLLSAIGLGGMSLKQAPKQQASKTDPLSFRDFGDLIHLPHRRLDNEELVHERHPPKMHKLRQAIDVLFGAHDQALVDANASLDQVRSQIGKLDDQITTIREFLAEQEIDEDRDLKTAENLALTSLEQAEAALDEIEDNMTSATQSADELRSGYAREMRAIARLTATIRDRETLSQRLSALRAQYADDLSKLRFAAETQKLFDPLSLSECPACLQRVEPPASADGATCGLCSQAVDLNDRAPFDVSKEVRDTETKLRELAGTTDQLERDVARSERDLRQASERLEEARQKLNEAVSARLAPFIAQRDAMQSAVTNAQRSLDSVRQTRSFAAGLDERRIRLIGLRTAEERLLASIQRIQDNGQDHTAVVGELSARFAAILSAFEFPKLEGPYLDERFVPHVRQMKYSDLGSGGAITLVSLAWHLAILEEAVEQEAPHPGLLMIDSPQKNLLADSSMDSLAKADAIYNHLIEWSIGPGSDSQVILVDNAPRPAGAPYVVVSYSGDPDDPPYGLIDDEVS